MTDLVTYPSGTVERWAFDYVTSTDLAYKRSPPSAPSRSVGATTPLRLARPGRPEELRVVLNAPKSPGRDALRAPERRAALVHTFLHHEVQAAELMCWAILAFPETPEAFRLGLVGIVRDEIRHVSMYEEQLVQLGATYGAFPVRDWFWERVPAAKSPAAFVATLGMGLEGANLDHCVRFAERFRAVGDVNGASIQERIGSEEVAHVRFAWRWFTRWTGLMPESTEVFAAWVQHLPPPLSPLLMRGLPLNRAARGLAGMSPAFLDELEGWSSPTP